MTMRRRASTCSRQRSLNLLVQTSARHSEHQRTRETTGHRGVSFTIPRLYHYAVTPPSFSEPSRVSGASLFRETSSGFTSAKFRTTTISSRELTRYVTSPRLRFVVYSVKRVARTIVRFAAKSSEVAALRSQRTSQRTIQFLHTSIRS